MILGLPKVDLDTLVKDTPGFEPTVGTLHVRTPSTEPVGYQSPQQFSHKILKPQEIVSNHRMNWSA